MCDPHRLPRRRPAFTLVEMLVVMVLILVIMALGVGYVVFGQSNQHSVVGANAVTGAMLNAKQRAHHDGVPTGVRLLFGQNGQCGQIVLIQQPEDYNAGQFVATTPTAPYTLTFKGTDFQGGADYPGQIDQSTVEAGDYFVSSADTPPLTPHRINRVVDATDVILDSPVNAGAVGQPYYIIRAPRRLASEDIIQLPPSVVIDNTMCLNVPYRTLIDYPPNAVVPNVQQAAEIVFGPAGPVIGQGTAADKVLLWLRDPGQPQPYLGVPLIVSTQVRTGLISVYPVAPWTPGQPVSPGNDPYRYAEDGRASGM